MRCRSRNHAFTTRKREPVPKDSRKCKWRAANHERVRAGNKRGRTRRRARKAGAFTGCLLADAFVEFIRKTHRILPCYWRGKIGARTHDHLTPLAKSGLHEIGNLQAACVSCNSSKRDRTVSEYIAWLKQAGRPAPALDHTAKLIFLMIALEEGPEGDTTGLPDLETLAA